MASMSVAEVTLRGRQAGSKWIDRLRGGGAPHSALDVLRRYAPALAPGNVVDSVARTFDERFFLGASARTAATLNADAIARIRAEADRLLNNRYDLLGYRDLSFGSPIDWHLDPISNRRSPLSHWGQINVLDASKVGDSKIIWELSRHQWMVRLAQATLVTGDARYGAHALSAMRDWIAANPVGYGINWASSLEVALRLISWSWLLALLRQSSLLTEDVVTMVAASIHGHAAHIEKYMSVYYSPNTHLTGEALGLFYAGTLYPQFANAERWRELGARTLIDQCDRQFSSDGVYFEQSTCYQRYSCDFFLHFLLLADRSGFAVPAPVRARTLRAVEFLAAIVDSHGSMPAIGDADGGWLMPLCQREADDCRGTLSVAAAVFDRPEFADRSATEPLWLVGREPDALAMPRTRESHVFREGGYALLRAHEHEMLVDVGPIGSYGHGHADLLSVQCRIFGEPCLVDAGTYCYTGDAEWRDYFRSTAAHNTITIDERSQAVPDGPFGWQERPAATLLDWLSSDDISLVEAEHNAYPGITHRRRVMAIADGVFVVVDDLLGVGTHAFELTFQFAPMDVTLRSTTIARAATPSGHRLFIVPLSSAPLTAQIITGQTNPIRGWVSDDYGRKSPAPALVYSSRAPLPIRITTVMHPQHRSCAASQEY